ncbi:MAG: tRNA1(Val) (adenine(37)-N6)-methyltransferase [Eubacterium sp.]|nr:tRNA1(Val) (adenine(37)-N6)-methyltransferase [Eubacterium sp.]
MAEQNSRNRNPKAGIQLDDLQNGYYLYQSETGFRFGIDAVLLASFADVRQGESVIDLGCGNGIIPILLAARTEAGGITGLEIQAESAALARKSVAYNHLEERIRIVNGDIREAAQLFGAASFDVVTGNPPYMIGDHGLVNPDESLRIARHEVCCTLDEFTESSAKLLKSRGKLFMVHRPFRLAEILRTLSKHNLEPKRMRLVHPYADREPNLVLIEAVRGGRSGMRVEPPLIIYERPGVYTDEVLQIYGR